MRISVTFTGRKSSAVLREIGKPENSEHAALPKLLQEE